MSLKTVSKMVSAKSVKDVYKSADTTNFHGAPAWTQTDEQYIMQLMMTGTMGNTFYVSQKDVVDRSLDFINRVANEKPSILANAIVVGRNDGFIRTAPIMGLVALSKSDTELFKSVFNEVIRTGNDMEDFITFVRAFDRGFGSAVKSAMKSWIEKNATPYYAIKYTKQLGYAVRIARPKMDKNAVIDYVMAYAKGSDITSGIVEADADICAYEKAKAAFAAKDWKKAIEIIKSSDKIDPMALIGICNPPADVWRVLASNMKVMMFIKYLNKIIREGAMDVETAKKKITVDALKKAKVFPFRLYIAYRALMDESADTKICNHLAKVLDEYVTQYDWGKWNKKFVIAPDVSGSMTSRVNGSNLSPAVVAGMFSGFLYKGIEDSVLVPWADSLKMNLVLPKSDSVISHIDKIANSSGGGTSMEIPVDHMINKKIDCDYFVSITDSEEWSGRSGWLATWVRYKKNHPKAKAILIRVDGYNTKPFSDADAQKHDIYQVYGWSDSVIGYIESLLS